MYIELYISAFVNCEGREYAVAFTYIDGGSLSGFTELYLSTSAATSTVTVRHHLNNKDT